MVTKQFFMEISDQPGVALELTGFGITCFDPHDVARLYDDESVVGGTTTLFLTKSDVERLRAMLAEIVL